MRFRNLVAVIAVTAIPGITAQTSRANPPELPVARTMVLSPSDFAAGATVASDANNAGNLTGRLKYYSAYTRHLSSVRIKSNTLPSIIDSAVVAPDAGAAAKYVRGVASFFATRSDRTLYLLELRGEINSLLGKTASKQPVGVSLVRERRLKIGDTACEAVAQYSLGPAHVYIAQVYVQEQAVVESLTLLSLQPIALGDTGALADLVALHVGAALAPPPANASLPTVSGTAEPGDELVANPGQWSGKAITYAYQWLQCPPSGTSCSPIAGAVSSTYIVRAGDQGSGLAVDVRATSPAGASTAKSEVTAVDG